MDLYVLASSSNIIIVYDSKKLEDYNTSMINHPIFGPLYDGPIGNMRGPLKFPAQSKLINWEAEPNIPKLRHQKW